ncbi:MAG: hypothetical protein PUC32_07675 [Oscillospiraceae bacterium]|nr:hypothetical protein [Oscillospiraceae bacterium]
MAQTGKCPLIVAAQGCITSFRCHPHKGPSFPDVSVMTPTNPRNSSVVAELCQMAQHRI